MISLNMPQTPCLVRESGDVDFALSIGIISLRIRSPNLRHNSDTVLAAV